MDDFVAVLRLLKVDFDEREIRQLAPINVSPNPLVQWDPGLRELVTRLEYPALVRYGYVDVEEACCCESTSASRLRLAA